MTISPVLTELVRLVRRATLSPMERELLRRAIAPSAPRSLCKRRHPQTADNVVVRECVKNGRVYRFDACRPCDNERSRSRRRR